MLEIEKVVEELAIELDVDMRRYRIEGLDVDGVSNTIFVYIDVNKECYAERYTKDVLIKIMCRKIRPNVNDIYRSTALRLTSIFVKLLKPFINRNEEYMAILLNKGVAVVLEGTSRKIVTPWIPGTLFTCHTHPNTMIPVFSERDAISLLEVLSYRGLGGCVASQSMCFTLYRCGIFAVEDYEKLFNLIKRYRLINKEIIDREGPRSIRGILTTV